MKYYVWVNGCEGLGLVKADNIEEATHKVIMSQGKCKSIQSLDYEQFDSYDVAVLESNF